MVVNLLDGRTGGSCTAAENYAVSAEPCLLTWLYTDVTKLQSKKTPGFILEESITAKQDLKFLLLKAVPAIGIVQAKKGIEYCWMAWPL